MVNPFSDLHVCYKCHLSFMKKLNSNCPYCGHDKSYQLVDFDRYLKKIEAEGKDKV